MEVSRGPLIHLAITPEANAAATAPPAPTQAKHEVHATPGQTMDDT